MGYGVGSYKMAITPEVGDDALVAHNSYLSVLVEEGMVGLILYMTMLFSVVSAVRHLPRLERRFGLVLLTTLGTAMLPLTWEDQKQVWFITAVMIGMASLVRRPSASVGRAYAVDAPRARPVAVEAVQRAMARGPRIEGELGAGG
jgi:O-antigen ligase